MDFHNVLQTDMVIHCSTTTDKQHDFIMIILLAISSTFKIQCVNISSSFSLKMARIV